MRFQIGYNPNAVDHLRRFPTRERAIIMDAIEEQLAHEPMRETKNRKQLRPNSLAPWELRVANWRVFFDVQAGLDPIVTVVAIGEKRRNEIWVGGERVTL